MSLPGPFRLVHDTARNNAIQAVREAEQGYVVTIRPPNRTKDQNALLHACLGELSKQVVRHGERYSITVWKRLCTAAWLRGKNEHAQLLPALDGNGVDVIYEPTSEMNVQQMSELIEWVRAFGSENKVQFRE